MVFSSTTFLFLFLPRRARRSTSRRRAVAATCVLIAAGLVFYAWGAGGFVFVVLLVDARGLGCSGSAIERARRAATRAAPRLLLVARGRSRTSALLFYFKYAGFAAQPADRRALGARFGTAASRPHDRCCRSASRSSRSRSISLHRRRLARRRRGRSAARSTCCSYMVALPALDRRARSCATARSTISSARRRVARSTTSPRAPALRATASSRRWSSPTRSRPSPTPRSRRRRRTRRRPPPGSARSPTRCRSTSTSPATRDMAIGLGADVRLPAARELQPALLVASRSPTSGGAGT